MRKVLLYSFIVIFFGIIVFYGQQFISNFTYTRHITLPASLLASSSTDTGQIVVTPDVFGQTDPSTTNPASSTLDISTWKTYTNNELGFSLKYPSDLTINTNSPSTVVFFVPKDHYFEWPLLDDVKLSVSASSTCPQVVSGGLVSTSTQPQPLVINGYNFTRIQGSDAAAGNVYKEIAYDTTLHGICYHLSLYDHGTNGAGFYVSDQSLIAQYDAAHQTHIDSLVSVFDAFVGSFTSLSP